MKKKQKTSEHRAAAITTATATATATDLKSLIHDHSLFFDKLIELIPARFYLSNDDANDSKPWFQGLSKAKKASMKLQTKENLKKSRRDRLDPEKPQSTTLDLLKQSIETEKVTNRSNTDSEEDDDDEDVEEPVVKLDDDSRSVTYEELRHKLHRRIEELRSNRVETSNRREKREIRQIQRKRDRDSRDSKGGAFTKPAKSVVDIEKEVTEATRGIEFGKVKLGGEEELGRNKKRRKVSREKELEMAKQLQEVKNEDVEVAKKHSWKAATSRAAGVKVHDDPKLLKLSIHKEKKRQGKNAEKWKERVDSREKLKSEKQQKRAGNIAGRIQDKKARKIAKREKKLMRPGFEGRKEGYINPN